MWVLSVCLFLLSNTKGVLASDVFFSTISPWSRINVPYGPSMPSDWGHFHSQPLGAHNHTDPAWQEKDTAPFPSSLLNPSKETGQFPKEPVLRGKDFFFFLRWKVGIERSAFSRSISGHRWAWLAQLIFLHFHPVWGTLLQVCHWKCLFSLLSHGCPSPPAPKHCRWGRWTCDRANVYLCVFTLHSQLFFMDGKGWFSHIYILVPWLWVDSNSTGKIIAK